MTNIKKTINIITFLGVLALVALMFADVILELAGRIVAKNDGELFNIFLPYHKFAFTGAGLSLWNPYISCGAPFLANIETGSLYLPNWINLVFQPPVSTNINILMHLMLAAWGMYLWGGARGQNNIARAVSSLVFIFSAPFFLLVYTGALSNLMTIAWAPLMFLSAGMILKKKGPLWIFLGILAGSMQVFAGHIQLFFYVQIVLGMYFLIGLRGVSAKVRALGSLLLVYAGIICLTAVQLFPSLAVLKEVVRGDKLTFEFASLFSFPPENLITLVIPNFFGHLEKFPYWGRWFLWEVSIFVGIGGLLLALCAAFMKERSDRIRMFVMTGICIVLAMGSYTPLFAILFKYFPGFDLFRGTSKFLFPGVMFLASLAGDGAEWLLCRQESNRRREALKTLTCVSFLLGLFLLAVSFAIKLPFSDTVTALWDKFLHMFPLEEKQNLVRLAQENPRFIQNSGAFARGEVLFGVVTAGIFGVLFFISRKIKTAKYIILAFALIELMSFAYSYRAFNEMPPDPWPESVREFFKEHPGDYRVFWPGRERENAGMSAKVPMLWGQLPPTKRYAEFMFFTQGLSPDDAGGFLKMRQYNELYKMLRCRYIVVPDKVRIEGYKQVFEGDGLKIFETDEELPRAFIARKWIISSGRDELFNAMVRKDFSPDETVVLEEAPGLEIDAGTKSGQNVKVVGARDDELYIEADLKSPAILVVTDSYASGWIAEDADNGREYKIIPANYVLMGIPLDAGEHFIRMRYSPRAFIVGRRLSVISFILFLLAAIYFVVKRATNR